jgi:HEAT repeat protein
MANLFFILRRTLMPVIMLFLTMVVIFSVSNASATGLQPLAAEEESSREFEGTLSAEEKKLFALVDHDSPNIRLGAIKGLAGAKGIKAMPFLKLMINKPDQAFEVLKLMVDIDIAESAPYLIEAVEKRIEPDESRLSGLTEQNVIGVIQLLKRRLLSQATPVLVRTLADKSAAIRESAALTLGHFGKQDAVEPLRKLAATELVAQVRMSALVALAKLGDAGSRETLKKILSEGKDMLVINYTIKLLKQSNIKIND